MSWYSAPSLVNLGEELDKRFPNRKKPDGTIASSTHTKQNPTSDHEVNSRGSVNGRDFYIQGLDPKVLMAWAKKHPSTRYFIFNKKIYSRKVLFVGMPYFGSNPHTSHIHVSIYQTLKAEQDQTPWSSAPNTTPWPLSGRQQFGWRDGARWSWYFLLTDSGPNVRKINESFGLRKPGKPGSSKYTENTAKAVSAWEKSVGLPVTGMIDSRRWKRRRL